jgi:hypothetical protein
LPRPSPLSLAFALPLLAAVSGRGATLRQTYLDEVRSELAKTAAFVPAPMDARAIAGLPEPVRKYFSRCGFLDRPAMRNVRLDWAEFEMQRGRDYLRWEAIDSLSARAVFTHAGRSVSGVFRFNPEGEYIGFETGDRWQDGHDDAPIPWSITAGDYADMGGFRLPTRMTATWHEQAGDFRYFRGRLAKAEYDVGEP